MKSLLGGHVSLHHGDSRQVLQGFDAASFDSCVTDPPYALTSIVKRFGADGAAPAKANGVSGVYARASSGFMGQKWDTGDTAFAPAFWGEVLRVMKPGAHLLAFGGSRTYHRLACAIEDAGFEIRDQIMWIYGCLDEQTEVATADGVRPHHKTKEGDLVLCYDPATGEYSYQPVLEVVEYEYEDTAYRLVGDFGEQVVSRNHRCIVERDGSEAFQFAETLEREARVPILESLPALRQALSDAQSDAGRPQPDLQSGLHEGSNRSGEQPCISGGDTSGQDAIDMLSLRDGVLSEPEARSQGEHSNLLAAVQRASAGPGVGCARSQGPCELAAGIHGCASTAHDRNSQSVLEGWVDVSEPEGGVCRSADQVRALPAGISEHGPKGRVCDGAQIGGGIGDWQDADAGGSRASCEPRRNGQSAGKSYAVRDERAAQGVRAWRGHRTSVVRVVPFHYVGKVWCLRVPTGAFVAVRNGVAFPTGNSGFPKSHNQGNGWGTALKPAHEPIVLARKPLIGTVAQNIAEHGVGALNIDGCRVGVDASEVAIDDGRRADTACHAGYQRPNASMFNTGKPVIRGGPGNPAGRWPANVIHDGSDEVVSAFPDAAGQQGPLIGHGNERQSPHGVFGKMGPAHDHLPRGDAGSAARFFYAAKADSDERAGSKHPTVKPVDLMQYCVRLITPRGGLTLDPFAGTGTTGEAAWREGVRSVLIEREERFCLDIERRMELALSGPDERRRRMTAARGETMQPDGLPLFGGDAA